MAYLRAIKWFSGGTGGGGERGSVVINRICRGGLKKTDCQFTANEE